MNFVLGVVSSVFASVIVVAASRVSLRWLRAFPRGVEFVRPNRHEYVSRIAAQIRQNRNALFFKGMTGYDLFSADLIRSALEETRVDVWKQIVFVLTSPKSPAFHTEPNRFYTAERLAGLQKVAVDFLNERALATARPNEACTRGIFYVTEPLTLINLLVLDSEAFVFFRGFTDAEGPAGQVIVRLQLSKCPQLIRDLVEYVRRYYIEQCVGAGGLSAPD